MMSWCWFCKLVWLENIIFIVFSGRIIKNLDCILQSCFVSAVLVRGRTAIHQFYHANDSCQLELALEELPLEPKIPVGVDMTKTDLELFKA